MTHRNPATDDEAWRAANALGNEGKPQSREALLSLARQLCTPEWYRKLEAITDLAELQRRVQAMLESD